MNKQKFTRADIQAVLTVDGIDTERARNLTAQIIEAITAALAADKTVELRGLGTLKARERKARTLRNPQNMEPVHVPARRVVFFRPGQELKKQLQLGLESEV